MCCHKKIYFSSHLVEASCLIFFAVDVLKFTENFHVEALSEIDFSLSGSFIENRCLNVGY